MKAAPATAVLIVLALVGCQDFDLRTWDLSKFDLRSQSPDEEEHDTDKSKSRSATPLIGEYTSFAGLNVIALHGVGLVTGLDGTGGDPSPSVFRTRLYREMQNEGIKDVNAVLKSPNTTMVMIKAYLPPLARKGDKFDIEVYVPPGTETTSLNGGWLMAARLLEQAIAPGSGRLLDGRVYAKAEGPILISTGSGNEDLNAGSLRRGRVLGGGIALKERDMAIYLRNDYRGTRMTNVIANRIGQRFYQYNERGLKEPLAKAKDDQKIELKIQDRYRDNFPRYLQIIRNIALRETDVAQRVRMEKLKDDLRTPETSEIAALRLEAIGQDALPALKEALDDPRLEIRFHAAMALAYLGSSDGVKVLAEAARDEPAFRVFALASLAAVDDSQVFLELRKLMNERSAETRYGAFRALTTINEKDPFVKGELLNDQFMLHVLNTEGEPMIHLTNRRKAEIVLFGADQRIKAPFVARAGRRIQLRAVPGRDEVVISRFEAGRPDLVETVSSRIADVIRTVASERFGASFPDVAQLLMQADMQYNLPSRLEIDALPKPGRVYTRPDESNSGQKPNTRVGNPHAVPNLFGDEDEQDSVNDGEPEIDSGSASLADASVEPEKPAAQRDSPDAGSEPKPSASRFNLLRFLRRTPEPSTDELD
jgi:flagellar basal body P-ring protein FlgI